jgi:thymidylate synthase (FAD)
MAEVRLNVQLLERTKEAVSLIYAACRQCYSAQFAGDILESKADKEKQESFIKNVLSSGHESPLEHAKFTFAVEGVSRALTHQLVRHRVASYSQQSQRYVKASGFGYVVPPSIAGNQEMKEEFISIMDKIQESYNKLIGLFESQKNTGEKANQDARFVLPQAAETKIVVSMNCRQLLHFFSQRCCARAQWEIRELADRMLSICKKELPAVFSRAGAKCIRLGYCPEGKKFTCGKYPLKKDFLNK